MMHGVQTHRQRQQQFWGSVSVEMFQKESTQPLKWLHQCLVVTAMHCTFPVKCSDIFKSHSKGSLQHRYRFLEQLPSIGASPICSFRLRKIKSAMSINKEVGIHKHYACELISRPVKMLLNKIWLYCLCPEHQYLWLWWKQQRMKQSNSEVGDKEREKG